MGHQVSLKNVKNYLQGNARLVMGETGILEEHIMEQVAYRMEICKDTCGQKGKCKHCGCSYPGRLYSSSSCNKGELFPDMMDSQKWQQFKIDNDIK